MFMHLHKQNSAYIPSPSCGLNSTYWMPEIILFFFQVFNVLHSRIQAAAMSLVGLFALKSLTTQPLCLELCLTYICYRLMKSVMESRLMQSFCKMSWVSFWKLAKTDHHHTMKTLSRLCLKKLLLSTPNYLLSGCCMARWPIIFRRFLFCLIPYGLIISFGYFICDCLPLNLQVNWCIMQEKERTGHYLHPTSVLKLIQVPLLLSSVGWLCVDFIIESPRAATSFHYLDFGVLLIVF